MESTDGGVSAWDDVGRCVSNGSFGSTFAERKMVLVLRVKFGEVLFVVMHSVIVAGRLVQSYFGVISVGL